MSTTNDLEKLQQLRQSGALSEEEFTRAKAKLLDAPSSAVPPAVSAGVPMTSNQWAMLLHLSQLIPFLGIVAPIIIWQVKKAEIPILDVHGKIVVNWLISALIYSVAGALLAIIGIGFLIMMAVSITTIVFAIIGGIKANNGEVWPYPMSLKLIK
jgi:uncharacterized Tic20 family protein